MVISRNNNQTQMQQLGREMTRRKDRFGFLQSLAEVLVDITALEINTMVVERISGDPFIPWQAYRDIYLLTSSYLEEKGVHPSLREPYLELRRKLELEYALLLADPDSDFEDLPENYPILTDPTVDLDTITSRLPNPTQTNKEEIIKTKKLLNNSRFVRSLRKMRELKIALDNCDRALARQERENPQGENTEELQLRQLSTDSIYAQTIVHLDGQILNRYAQEIFHHPHKEQILAIHQDGVEGGTRQWRELLSFIIHFNSY